MSLLHKNNLKGETLRSLALQPLLRKSYITDVIQIQLRRSERIVVVASGKYAKPRRGDMVLRKILSSLRDLGILRQNSIVLPSLRDYCVTSVNK